MRVLCVLSVLLSIAAFPASAAAFDIVALGASNSNGKGVGPGEAFPARIEAMLRSKGMDARVNVSAVNGQDTAAILSSVDSSVPDGTALVLLEPDRSNDRAHGLSMEENAANLKAIVARLARRGIKTIIVDPHGLPRSDFQGDGVHLSPQGHEDVAARYLPRILSMIKGRRS